MQASPPDVGDQTPLTSSWDTGACVGAGTADTDVGDDDTKDTEPTSRARQLCCYKIS